jgi:lipoate-protein ligase B
VEKKGLILDLGLIDYKKAWDLQHQLWLKRVEERLPDLLLILEHPHVITLGRRGNRSSLLVSPEVLKEMGIALFQVERGGEVTYHGPGQLVGYPILNLKDYGYRVTQYIYEIEEVLIRALRDFGIEGNRDFRNRGVWVRDKKIASIGIAIQRWVSFHGFALNYRTELKYFEWIYPCGLQGVKMTSMKEMLGKEISRDRLVERVSFHFKEIFQREWEQKTIEEICNSEI